MRQGDYPEGLAKMQGVPVAVAHPVGRNVPEPPERRLAVGLARRCLRAAHGWRSRKADCKSALRSTFTLNLTLTGRDAMARVSACELCAGILSSRSSLGLGAEFCALAANSI